MKTLKHLLLLVIAVLSWGLGGCATYRNSSNVSSPERTDYSQRTPVVIITEGTPQEKYTEIGPIEISIKKLTVFNADPTREQANDLLKEKARVIGADAVIHVRYESGIGMTTWGYMDAKGMGVKMDPTPIAPVAEVVNAQAITQAKVDTESKPASDPAKKIRELNGLLKDGLITKADYDKKKADILSGM